MIRRDVERREERVAEGRERWWEERGERREWERVGRERREGGKERGDGMEEGGEMEERWRNGEWEEERLNSSAAPIFS